VSDHKSWAERQQGLSPSPRPSDPQRIPDAAGCIRAVAIAAHRCGSMGQDAPTLARSSPTPGHPMDAGRTTSRHQERGGPRGHFTLEAAEKRPSLQFRTEAAIAKMIASEGGGRWVDRAMQIMAAWA